MPSSIVALQIFVLFLPGFLSLTISRAVATYKSSDTFDKIVFALIFNLFNALIYSTIAWLVNLKWPNFINPLSVIEIQTSAIKINPFLQPQNIVCLVLIAIFSGGFHAFLMERSLIFKLFRVIKVTTKTGKVDVWSDTFSSYNTTWARIELENGTKAQGWVKYSSDTSIPMELLIQDVAIYNEDGDKIEEIPAMLITRNAIIKSISLWPETLTYNLSFAYFVA